MPTAGKDVLIEIEGSMPSWYGVFAGYDTQTENYIIEDCYYSQTPNIKLEKRFFNRKFVKTISVIN